LIGILGAAYLYSSYKELPSQIALSLGPLSRLVERKFYIDDIYTFVAKRIMIEGIGTAIAWFDRHIVDGTMNLIGRTTLRIGAGAALCPGIYRRRPGAGHFYLTAIEPLYRLKGLYQFARAMRLAQKKSNLWTF